MKINLPFVNVYKNKNIKSKVVTQLLYGDTFKIIKKNKSWIKIKNNSDNYEGFVKNKSFAIIQKNTHKVCKLQASLYLQPSNKNKIQKKLSFGSKIKVTEAKKYFCKFDNFWIKKKDIKKVSYKKKDIFSDANKFINVKYKWGGKNFSGLDCSALVQLLLNYNNKFCPRDSENQLKYFKKKIKKDEIKKNDLIFWKGHVAIALSKKKMIHAYGPLKKVVVMSTTNAINRIYKTANLKVVGIRRVF